MIRIAILIVISVSFTWGPPTERAASAPASSAASQPSDMGKVTDIKTITREMLKKSVTIQGTVDDIVSKPSRTRERIYIHTVSEKDASIEVIWWEDLAKKLKDKAPAKGDLVRIRGRVDEYRGKLQIAPAGASDVRIIRRASKKE